MMEYRVGRIDLHISHLSYADEVLIFTNGTSRSLSNFVMLIARYENSSGQMVNKTKNGFYLGARGPHISSVIPKLTGYLGTQFPFLYLGVPIPMYIGRQKPYFANI